MNGAVLYSSRYGSTGQYAEWIGKRAGLPVLNVDKARIDLSDYDFLVLGTPVIYHKLMFDKWMKRNAAAILQRPTILFSVSGAGPGKKLDEWIAGCLPPELISHVTHFALRGRQNPKELTLFDRGMLIIGGLTNPDRAASREEIKGFDYMDEASVEPIVAKIAQLRGKKT